MGKTDIWMPVFIGDYLADTMHLSTEQHGAYLLLLFHLWRRGSLRDDDAALAQITGLPENAWNMHRAALAEFFKISDGLWQHGRVEKERTRVAATQLSKAKKAKLAASSRWSQGDASSNAQALPGDADSDSDSEVTNRIHPQRPSEEPQVPPLRSPGFPVETRGADQVHAALSTESRTQWSLPAARSRKSGCAPVGMTNLFEETSAPELELLSSPSPGRVSDSRHSPFRAILAQYWQAKNHASPEMPWQGRDAKALSDFLAACPRLNETQFRLMLGNRAKSAVAHGDRVYLWIGNLTRFQEEITVYNKPASAGGGHASRAEINRNSVVNAVDGALMLAQEHAGRVGQAGTEPPTLNDAGVPAADGTRPGRCALAVPRGDNYRLATRHPAHGQTGTDGSLPYRAAATTAGTTDADGRQEVTAW